MSRLRLHRERHNSDGTGWLRAAVLGANDGLISTASLVLGVAAAAVDHQAVLIAAVAALVAGALSMAAGEYVSVSSQADAEKADLAREERELREDPVGEQAELASIYESWGLRSETAAEVAEQLMTEDALATHARDELGLSPTVRAHPIQAALASAAAFIAGAAAPILVVAVTAHAVLVPALWGACLSALVMLGVLAARVGGASPWRAGIRVVFWGAVAMGITATIGDVVGHAV